MARERSAEELGEDLDEIKAALDAIRDDLKAGYVPRELYEARHTALRSEVALELAAIKAQAEADRKTTEGARHIAMWALGMVASAVIVALVGFLVAGAGGAA